MKADTRTLQQVLHGDRRFVIPVYQRPYVWDRQRQWEPLWSDLEATIRRLGEARIHGHAKGHDAAKADQAAPPHFLGAVVVEQSATQTGELELRLVVDGQQRLTTLQLLLRGVLDALEELGCEKALQAKIRKLIRNDDEVVPADQLLKVRPRPADAADFSAAMEAAAPAEEVSVFAEARAFFANEALGFLQDDDIPADPYGEGTPVARRGLLLVGTLLGLVKLVVIDLEDVDDAQVIFEALNARGTPLSATDLVKNLLFMRAEAQGLDPQAVYDELWKRFDDDAGWWVGQVGVGHAQRARQDWLLGDWLIAELGRTINVGRLYGEFRRWLDTSGTEPFSVLQTLNIYATAYEVLNGRGPGATAVERRAFRNIERLSITAATPVLLWLLVQPADALPADDRELAIRAIESFVVRRMAAKWQTRAYAAVFAEVLKHAKAAPSHPGGAVIDALANQPHGYGWPTLPELEDPFANARYYGPGGIGQDRVRLLLGAVDERLHEHANKSETPSFEYDALQVEHVIPQSWRTKWPVASSDPIEQAVLEQQRGSHLNRIGNLTLVTGPLNVSLNNDPWKAKRAALAEHSKLELNALLIKEGEWDEAHIQRRGHWLAQQVDAVWPGPDADAWCWATR